MKAQAHLLVLQSAVDAEELAGLRLFAGADLELVADVLRDCSMHVLRKNEVLLAPGATNQNLYLLMHGRLRVQPQSPETGPVRFIEAGEAVGEVSLIDEKPVAVQVIADTGSTVLAIDHDTFWSLVNASHAVARNMLQLTIERMRANNKQVAEGLQVRDKQQRAANVDELTGLRNARALLDLLRRQMLRSTMNRKPLALLALDIENFADFNAEFGTHAGDQAIHAVAQALQENLRPTDIAARFEGDKFTVILPECDAIGAGAVAARLRDAIAETVVVMPDESILPPVTVSIGFADGEGVEKAEDFIAAANAALQRFKNRRRNAQLS